MAVEKISLSGDDVQYLCFEGGVGRGIIYIKVVEALENIINDTGEQGTPHAYGVAPLFPIDQDPIESRRFRGISGASAGAITAFMLAMGMTSNEIEAESKAGQLVRIHKGRIEKWAEVEKFFGEPDPFTTRVVSKKTKYDSIDYDHYSTNVDILEKIKWWTNVVKNTRLDLNMYDKALESKLLQRFSIIGDLDEYVENPRNPPGITLPPRGARWFFKDHDNLSTYIHGLLYNRGLFSGKEIREFFRKLIEKKLKPVHRVIHDNYAGFDPFMPFKEFFNLTGVDLVITGTNVSNHLPLYFSVWHTPDFPVIEAVAISMNFPFAFRPIYVDMPVRGSDKAQEDKYRGLYVDGGMLNNYPVHAFDTIDNTDVLHDGTPLLFKNQQTQGAKIAVEPQSETAGDEKYLGFRLTDINAKGDPDIQKMVPVGPTHREVYPSRIEKQKEIMKNYLEDLLGTFMYPGSDGQIRFKNDEARTVYVDSFKWDPWDFAHPSIDQKNIEIISNNTDLDITIKKALIKKYADRIIIKRNLFLQAYNRTKYWVGP